MKKFMKMAVMFTLVLSILSLTACGKKNDGKSKLESIKEKKTLVVGMNAEFAPFEFHANVNGSDKVVGFDVDLAQAIADDMGVKLEIKEMEFDPLIQTLKAGQVDLVISGMVPNEERKAQVDFSDFYFTDSNVALINNAKAGEYKTVDDLLGKAVCYQLGSYQESITKKVFGEKNLKVLDSTNTILLNLKAQQIDAFITSKIVAEQAMAASKDYSYVEDKKLNENTTGIAVAIQKGENDLTDSVNKTIKKLIDSKQMDKYVSDACALAAKNVNAQ